VKLGKLIGEKTLDCIFLRAKKKFGKY